MCSFIFGNNLFHGNILIKICEHEESRAQYRCTNKHSLHDSEEKKVYMGFTHHVNRETYKTPMQTV